MRGPALRAFCEAVFSRCDVLHAPVVDFATPTIVESEVGGSPEMMAVLGRITRLTRPISYLGLPALAVPAAASAAASRLGTSQPSPKPCA